MSFGELGLVEPLLATVEDEGYEHPTPVQRQAIPRVLERQDVLACAQTGTGKTAAFALPILQLLSGSDEGPSREGQKSRKHPIRALVVAPTRELAAQATDFFRTYGEDISLRTVSVYGGVRQTGQTRALKKGCDILVATPGRLLDLENQGHIDLGSVEILVLDEADRMLDMGFIDDIRKIIRLCPKKRQTLLFSATIPQRIRSLANTFMNDPAEIHIEPEYPAAENVDQSIYYVELAQKQALLEHLLQDDSIERALIFTGTKRMADRVALHLNHDGIPAETIHSDKPQRVRERTLEKFKAGEIRVLIASDIAARGLDVEDISHVINFDMPTDPETYVHRIGRTGRAGAEGKAYSFCGAAERVHLDEIQKLINREIHIVKDHPFVSPLEKHKPTRKPVRYRSAGRKHPVRRKRLI